MGGPSDGIGEIVFESMEIFRVDKIMDADSARNRKTDLLQHKTPPLAGLCLVGIAD